MWVVAKIKIKNLNVFKKDLVKKVGNDIEFYQPKIEYHRYFGDKIKRFEKLILENYIFCYHKRFQKSSFVNQVKFLKGLEYFLHGYNLNQNNITKFIKYCKSFENEEGYLTQSFFKTIITKRAQFISGPFTNMFFEILEKQKNKLKILVSNIVMTIPNSTNYLYRPI
jgi:hypothetical protein|tara:strand:- start:420 stop:920 length:501 start_codon:yes stop_codon:yes gene_type:complete